jgi:hypothetical protein
MVTLPKDSGCFVSAVSTATHRILHGVIHVLQHRLHPDGFLDLLLRLDIVWIGVQQLESVEPNANSPRSASPSRAKQLAYVLAGVQTLP